jgi:hypothetical protein
VTLSDDIDPGKKGTSPTFEFRGGCTIILDLQTLKLKYVIRKSIDDEARVRRQRDYRSSDAGASLRATYFGSGLNAITNEPFALLHSDL